MDTRMRASNPEAHTNVHTMRRLFKALTAGDVAGADQFVSPQYRDREALGAGNARPQHGAVQFRESVRWLHGVFADLEFEEQEVIAADDRVVVRGVLRGRHVGELLGIAPTGRRVEVPQVHIFRLADSKVIEHREIWSELSVLLQLGLISS